ncbi:hypothetical protein MBRA1_001319 [Malassezia brasiliensis]|uniref:BAG domain-containing protein n=1 Tax=Malassezia brasiliensis TaxID=1821822 RepID=A0AAF0DRC0_9BASI|nr:hypothetical protein MBRA1_001319 [Malassezia brasiliensis]
MSWFSNQWNRWNNNSAHGWSDVEWVEVVYERQLYQVSLSRVQGGILLRDLRQELAQVFSLPLQQVKILYRGMVLKDDRVPLYEYGLRSGSRVVLAVHDAEHKRRQAQGAAAAQSVPAQQAPPQMNHAQGVPHTQGAQPPLQSMPPGTAPVPGAPGAAPAQPGAPHTMATGGAAPNAESAAQPAPPPEPQLSPEEKHLQQIASVEKTVRDTLLPELVQFEQSVASLPNAAKGAQSVTNEGNELVPTKRIPITQRKLSEYLLRELMKLDGVPVDSDEVRAARKSTVKEIQSYLDRVDTAWKLASDAKGVVNDI